MREYAMGMASMPAPMVPFTMCVMVSPYLQQAEPYISYVVEHKNNMSLLKKLLLYFLYSLILYYLLVDILGYNLKPKHTRYF